MYARRKDSGLGDLLVDVSHNKDYHAEYTDCEKSSIKKDIFTRKVKISADISKAKLKRLIHTDRCPVHRTLEETSIIKTEFV